MRLDHAKLWGEGRYIDLWTIPHILAGILLAGFLFWFGVPFWLNIVISSFLIIGWEFFELHFLNVHEHIPNKVMDVATGLIGFVFVYQQILKYSIETVLPYLFGLTIIYILLNCWGFMAHKERKLDQQ